MSRRNLRNGLLFVGPWLFGMSVLLLYPIIGSFFYSFTEYSVLEAPVYVGTRHYADLFADPVFAQALWNTLVFLAMAIPLGLVASLGLALLLNAKVKGLAVFRAAFFFPALLPGVVMAVLWKWMLGAKYGIVNSLLKHIHIAGPAWLSDAAWSKPSLVLIGLWGIGHAVVIYLASLQDVPQQLYEAAEIDGAGWLQKTRHVTLPMISPVIFFNVIMSLIAAVQFFTIPFVISPDGSPERSIKFLAMYLYDQAFTHLHMGYASAIAWIMFLIVLLLTLIAVRVSRKHVHYFGT